MPEEEFVEQKSKKICLVSVFSHAAFFVPLSHLREILGEICPGGHSILVVSPELAGSMAFDPKKDYVIFYKKQNGTLSRLMNYGVMNLKISKKILFGSKEVTSYVFFWATGFLLPMICAKVRRKKIIWLLPSSIKKMDEHRGSFLRPAVVLLQDLSYTIADKIVLYSPNLIQEWGLQKYADKILIAHEHFLQLNACTAAPPLSGRPRLIGYIGRLSEEKGIRAFVRALPAIIGNRKDLQVLIGGTGPLEEETGAYIQEEKLTSHVKIAGWISRDHLPEYLKTLQLLVIPSSTEGLPNIMLEAMACGTPVAAASVGAIPDVIREGETGYILKDTSPEGISETIMRILDDPEREHIAVNAKKMVKKEFSIESTVRQWKRVLEEI
jgi:glycosyltransferase involved in cell wall biosynthesis